jgi:hypothetical protein
VTGAAVAVTGSSQPHRDIAAMTTTDGRFRFGGMRPGSYRVTVRAGNSTRSAEVVVSAGAPVDVEIRLDE